MNAPATTIERAVKERGIPFSGPMVRAILGGTKTQTRRLVKPQPSFRYPGTVRLVYDQHPMSPSGFVGTPAEGLVGGEDRMGWLAEDWCGNVVGEAEAHALRCPYGVPGDRLYVREAWRTPESFDSLSGSAMAVKCAEAGYAKPWAPIRYEADGRVVNWTPADPGRLDPPGRYRHARFMPRWASRELLDVLEVRVERVRDISDADILAEGVTIPVVAKMTGTPLAEIPDLFSAWRLGWIHINGAESWSSNPWVWVVRFRRAGGDCG